jgi:hypothetical protein
MRPLCATHLAVGNHLLLPCRELGEPRAIEALTLWGCCRVWHPRGTRSGTGERALRLMRAVPRPGGAAVVAGPSVPAPSSRGRICSACRRRRPRQAAAKVRGGFERAPPAPGPPAAPAPACAGRAVVQTNLPWQPAACSATRRPARREPAANFPSRIRRTKLPQRSQGARRIATACCNSCNVVALLSVDQPECRIRKLMTRPQPVQMQPSAQSAAEGLCDWSVSRRKKVSDLCVWPVCGLTAPHRDRQLKTNACRASGWRAALQSQQLPQAAHELSQGARVQRQLLP